MMPNMSLEQIKIEDLTEDERRVWQHLHARRGRTLAIKGALLAEATGIPIRDLQRVITGLGERREFLITSCGQGYYIPASAAEVDAFVLSMRRRAISIFRKISRVKKMSMEQVLQQVQGDFLKEQTNHE